MHFRAPRALGALLLTGLAACAITTIASASTHPQSSTHSTSSHRTTHHHRHRRLPPGGCWARSAIVIDPASGEVLFDKNSDVSVPIASLSKLMTIMVFLDQKPDLDQDVVVSADDRQGAGHTQLRVGESVALLDLLHMSLMCSDNCATRVLVRESGLAPDDYLARMNHEALELGMNHTRFVEFTGLDEHNVSTAADVARMLRAAAGFPLIHEITTTREYEFTSVRRAHAIRNTDRLLYGNRYEILGGKTGFISEAGYCLATWIRTEGRDLIAVVLGAPTGATRFADTVRLVQRATSASLVQP
ncbi:MAG: D-alanyl-D-alanine carboxypeptidase [Candidatus Eisenbacteria bacterium]|nr:D-alanyl-D-alanine carboxypeptidase [Candidatus Eisenbacteria bacterium]